VQAYIEYSALMYIVHSGVQRGVPGGATTLGIQAGSIERGSFLKKV